MSPMTSVAGHVQIMVSSALHLRRISEQLGSCTAAISAFRSSLGAPFGSAGSRKPAKRRGHPPHQLSWWASHSACALCLRAQGRLQPPAADPLLQLGQFGSAMAFAAYRHTAHVVLSISACCDHTTRCTPCRRTPRMHAGRRSGRDEHLSESSLKRFEDCNRGKQQQQQHLRLWCTAVRLLRRQLAPG